MLESEYIWTGPYQAAIFELNSAKLPDQIKRAEEVIQKRRMELLESSQTGNELSAIEQALTVLNQLREISQKRA